MFYINQLIFKINFNVFNYIIFTRIILAFLVKLPIFLRHLWLPKAHVEAPVVGSIILASILLKLGGYGLLRISPLIFSNLILNLFISISLTGSGLIGFICLNQLDIKVIIAYSSVAHIGLVIRRILYLSKIRASGRIILIIAHGIRSSIIFFGRNLLYLRRFSRRILLRKGFLASSPLISFFWLFTILRRIAAPPLINFMAEIICIMRIIRFRLYNILWMGISVFLAGAYAIILYSSTQQSNLISNFLLLKNRALRELTIIYSHIFWIFILIIPINIFY